jgi:hypothetical protein
MNGSRGNRYDLEAQWLDAPEVLFRGAVRVIYTAEFPFSGVILRSKYADDQRRHTANKPLTARRNKSAFYEALFSQ